MAGDAARIDQISRLRGSGAIRSALNVVWTRVFTESMSGDVPTTWTVSSSVAEHMFLGRALNARIHSTTADSSHFADIGDFFAHSAAVEKHPAGFARLGVADNLLKTSGERKGVDDGRTAAIASAAETTACFWPARRATQPNPVVPLRRASRRYSARRIVAGSRRSALAAGTMTATATTAK